MHASRRFANRVIVKPLMHHCRSKEVHFYGSGIAEVSTLDVAVARCSFQTIRTKVCYSCCLRLARIDQSRRNGDRVCFCTLGTRIATWIALGDVKTYDDALFEAGLASAGILGVRDNVLEDILDTLMVYFWEIFFIDRLVFGVV